MKTHYIINKNDIYKIYKDGELTVQCKINEYGEIKISSSLKNDDIIYDIDKTRSLYEDSKLVFERRKALITEFEHVLDESRQTIYLVQLIQNYLKKDEHDFSLVLSEFVDNPSLVFRPHDLINCKGIDMDIYVIFEEENIDSILNKNPQYLLNKGCIDWLKHIQTKRLTKYQVMNR